MTKTDLWTTLAERNEFIPPSKVALLPEFGTTFEEEPILKRIVGRVVPDLPGPLPKDLFDASSARAAGALVACALARLHAENPVGQRLPDVASQLPSPQTPAQHVTQAAILWYAVPLARRMQSEAFRALNSGETTAETKEAIGEYLTNILARRPLLSLREDCEEFFSHSSPPSMDGVLESLGLRRWLIQRLASPCASDAALARRARLLRQFHEGELRETLVLLGKMTPLPAATLITEFLPLLARGQWPDDLAPSLRQSALALRKPPEEDPHDGPDLVA